jgi:hypothetical protein
LTQSLNQKKLPRKQRKLGNLPGKRLGIPVRSLSKSLKLICLDSILTGASAKEEIAEHEVEEDAPLEVEPCRSVEKENKLGKSI